MRRVGVTMGLALAVGLPVLAGAAEHGGEPGIINLNVTTLIQAINFLILAFLLTRFVFKPLSGFLSNRAEGIAKSLAQAEEARRAAAEAQERTREQLKEAQREMAALREQAQREVEAERQRLVQASRAEAQALVESARAEIAAETRRAKAALREETVNLALSAAERLLGRTLTGEDQRRIAEQYVQELGGKN
jgi:F-type H+-transporting ATPase subunit b